jgi:hypothetical protein
MRQHKLLKKLLDQHYKYGSIIVAYDFDDTVYPFSLGVEELKDTVNLIQRLVICGHNAYCYTSNEDIEKVTMYLRYNHIPYCSINKSPVDSVGKQFYNVLLDDKAGLNETKEVLEMFLMITTNK